MRPASGAAWVAVPVDRRAGEGEGDDVGDAACSVAAGRVVAPAASVASVAAVGGVWDAARGAGAARPAAQWRGTSAKTRQARAPAPTSASGTAIVNRGLRPRC